MKTAVILPVKRFAHAKQRLGGWFGGPERAVLAAAMVADVLDELTRVQLGQLIVVTSEPLGAPGALIVRDDREKGQSAAALLGLARARELPCDRALLIPGDCPLIDGRELQALVRRAESLDVVIVPDRHGTGTNGLALAVGCPFEPQFGPGSRDRHVAQAEAKRLAYEVIGVPSLQLDVDTGEDATALAQALARYPERAPHTRQALHGLDAA